MTETLDDLLAPIEGDLELKRVPVNARLNGEIRHLELVEMDGIRHSQWLTEFRKRKPGKVSTSATGGVEVDLGQIEMGGFQESLISLCLFDSKKSEYVPAEEIAAWPNTFREKLFKRARLINGMDDDAKATAKNDSTQGSDDG